MPPGITCARKNLSVGWLAFLLHKLMDTIARHHQLGFSYDSVAFTSSTYNQVVDILGRVPPPPRHSLGQPFTLPISSYTNPMDHLHQPSNRSGLPAHANPSSLDPPTRIVPSQRRDIQAGSSSWLSAPFEAPSHPSGGWTTASLIGIGALPATALRSIHHDNDINDQGLRSGGKKHYQCPGCDVVFERLSALKQHLLSHTGEKPHACPMCNRRFSIASNLKRHTRTCKVGKFKAGLIQPGGVHSNAGQTGNNEELIRKTEDDGTSGTNFGVSSWDGSTTYWPSSLTGSDGEDSAEADSASPPSSSSTSLPINRDYAPVRTSSLCTPTTSPAAEGVNWNLPDANFRREHQTPEPPTQMRHVSVPQADTHSILSSLAVLQQQQFNPQQQHYSDDAMASFPVTHFPSHTLPEYSDSKDRQASSIAYSHPLYGVNEGASASTQPPISLPLLSSRHLDYGHLQAPPQHQTSRHPNWSAATTGFLPAPTGAQLTPAAHVYQTADELPQNHYHPQHHYQQDPSVVWPSGGASHGNMSNEGRIGTGDPYALGPSGYIDNSHHRP